MEGNLRDLACTREEQTGTQLSEEARREQNNSLSPPPSLPPLYLSGSPSLLCQKSKARHNSLTRHGDPEPIRERGLDGGREALAEETIEMGVKGRMC